MTVAALAAIGSIARAPGDPHRLVLALVVVQLLLVAGDEQQRVVGRGADDEDEQDALALPVQFQYAVLRQRIDDERGQREAEDGGQQDRDRQDRAAVDDQQDDEHDRERDAEQDPVDPAERHDEVREDAARAGDVDL